MKEIIEIILVILAIFGCLFGAMMGLEIAYEQNYCKTMKSINASFEFQWELWGGCLVKTPSGYWIHAPDYQYLEGDVR